VGAARARELIYTGGMIGAEEALRIGLVNAVFPPEALMAETRKAAATIASMGPLAVAGAKRVILDGADIPLPEANAREVDAFTRCFDTADQREGMAAFLDKREPSFEGK
jgi:enoyl-CoA hydratase